MVIRDMDREGEQRKAQIMETVRPEFQLCSHCAWNHGDKRDPSVKAVRELTALQQCLEHTTYYVNACEQSAEPSSKHTDTVC